ncbi:MAG: UDP-N-acetylglucosamine 2-epimerase [Elusimicrobia bacterium]|nr:UDP-N-acetylglucosamine 2-epimerase [Elusimicrobiota bacterium]
MNKKICFVTGSRAEYGLLCPLIKRISKEKTFRIQIAVTGMHLIKDFGNTYREIAKDYKIDAKVDIGLKGSADTDVAHAVATGISGFTKSFSVLKPDFVILLGDRYEIFAAAISAFLLKIPLVHIHGGELTEGAVDDGLRHAITKMSSLHFTAAKEYRDRVIQMGEEPCRVFNVGSLGVENIHEMHLLSKGDLQEQLKINLEGKYLLVTFHPVTMEQDNGIAQLKNLLLALDQIKDMHIIFTLPNADAGGRAMIKTIQSYVSNNSSKASAFVSLGQLKYLSAMKYASAVVGNSSSGIIEAPSLKVPSVNIGDRQKGRLRAKSVIDCDPSIVSIANTVKQVLSESFKKKCSKAVNPYGGGNASAKIVSVIKRRIDLIQRSGKSFYDIGR